MGHVKLVKIVKTAGFSLICFNIILALILILRAIILPYVVENPCFDGHLGKDHVGGIIEPTLDERVIERFRKGLRFESVCWGHGNYNREELQLLTTFIKENYPTIHTSALIQWEVVNNYSLLYRINGKNNSIDPYLVLAHLDVVPADNQKWDYAPFAATLEDGYIYARGTLDDKHNVFAILESLELLLQEGFTPERTFYISFGHDEECMGIDGAMKVAKKLEERKVHFEFILDEGMVILEDMYASVKKPVAHIGVSEKGHLSVQLSVNFTGGHSSMPQHESSIGILAQAITRLHSNAHPSMLGRGVELPLLEAISYHTNWPMTVVLRNIWFFKPLLSWIMSMKPSSNAVIRTTTAVTMFNTGGKINVIPTYVEAVVNHRIHSAQTVNEVLEYNRQIIGDDRVKQKVIDSFEPIPQSCFLHSCPGYQIIKETVTRLWKGNVITVPASLVGNTDSRHFRHLTDNIYRFTPVQLIPEDLPRIHGENERISVDAYKTIIRFYYNFFLTVDKYHVHPSKVLQDEL